MRRPLHLLLLCLATLLLAPAVASAAVPRTFIGTNLDGPLNEDPSSPLSAEARVMHSSGIGSVRVAFPWQIAQPYPSLAAAQAALGADAANRLPRDSAGIPLDFARFDRVVGTLAQRGISVLPVVLQAPAWARRDASRTFSPPRNPQEYARYAGALVRRYGPRGSFWRENRRVPRRPIGMWQIWNEQTDMVFWDDPEQQPRPDSPAADRAYAQLLRAARVEIKRADRRAKLMLGGLFGPSWFDLDRYYKLGLRGQFDAVALQPFTKQISNIVTFLNKARVLMDQNGNRKVPLVVTEISWPSAAGKLSPRTRYLGFEVTPAQQARLASDLLQRLARERRRLNLSSVYWYTWATSDSGSGFSFDYAGLRRRSATGRFTSKPALRSWSAAARRILR